MTKPIARLLVTCRGEIAVRVIRAAKEMGITSIAAYSDADADALAVRLADESINIGGAHAKKSYLNQEALLAAADEVNADAVHPGYGFLSENASFANAVTQAGLIWVGPSGATIERMGHKAQAIATARDAGVPVVPGSKGLIESVEQALAATAEIGYPVLIKAAAGGGGRGIRVAHNDDELAAGIAGATQEAEAAFGDGGVYLERFIAQARHIEVQILGDGIDAVHFYERDCSLQRRRQKVWEEAPAAVLTPEVREKICQSAVALAKSVGYSGAGTIEYLYDAGTTEFYFIEMNTRIQVEHPITEEICGVDLIRAMIDVAGGAPLPYRQDDIRIDGHVIEVRINAENPDLNFMPAPGTIDELEWPLGPGIRIDSMAYAGYKIPPYYDSLIGKLIVHGATRDQALGRLRRALTEITLTGPATTIPFFARLLDQPDVADNEFHTTWIEQWMESQQ